MTQDPFGDPWDDPYATPREPAAPYKVAAGPPAVWTWYRVYCGCMAMLYISCTGVGIAMLIFGDSIADDMSDTDSMQLQIQGAVFAVLGVGLTILYVAPFLLPRSRGSWILGIVAIAIGLTSCCTLPASVPLLIFWLKDETKDFMNAR